jgi:hypothetical protein
MGRTGKQGERLLGLHLLRVSPAKGFQLLPTRVSKGSGEGKLDAY